MRKKRVVEGKSQFLGWLLQKAVASKALNEYPRKREVPIEQPLCSNELLAIC